MAQQRLVVGPADDDRVDLRGFGVVFRIGGHQTGGAFSIVEHPIAPRVLVRPHVHEREDEFTYVLEGEIGARIGDHEVTAGPGTYVCKPRRVPHAVWNPTDRPARLLEIISPAGFEAYFREFAAILAAPGPPDGSAIAALARRHGLTSQDDWIPDLVQRHGLDPRR
jgi:mannose-6-phosphate isomerase-like protein (cupin superfamily)